ncbi:MAG: T9SS type A sorting domain-containing protein [Ignavibacteria bacterium]|nr:T9SS type A sorting domain-containing protein [Ignavibacteria bacterium]
MKKLVLFSMLVCAFTLAINAQTLMTENFEYTVGTLLTANGYTAHSSAGTNAQTVVAGSLSYTGYALNSGNSLKLINSGEDVNKKFITGDSVSSGSVYVTFLVKVDSAKTGDYFLHLSTPGMSTSAYMLRVYVKNAVNGKLAFGLSKSTANATAGILKYTDSVYTTGTTYLLVAKYQFVAATDRDDIVSLWVNPATAATEPSPLFSIVDTASSAKDCSSLASVCFRQGSATAASFLTLDGLKISKSWPFASVVPVELSAFNASVVNNGVAINWATATETNNRKFVVEKNVNGVWSILAEVAGNGTSTNRHSYSVIDPSVVDQAQYRLQQVDFDGTVHYSNIVVLSAKSVKAFNLSQNYPNPFNPTTVISYSLTENSNVTLKVYNMLGKEVATLVEGMQSAGTHNVQFNANSLAAGTYFYTIKAGNFTSTKKLSLVK